ncbi:ferritin-like fold-containing protein [Actinotalea sp.]|uniref:ferritin-like fold-containing protein n=1 Tax=Actinotalea sp. TaxID=1872145 RepID=UPI002D019F58|nr:ferritin-like fold-containing protein [Actinotalea sp.]HRA49496.1 ferritin-like fold-containing protein [Actinotalea sp.]
MTSTTPSGPAPAQPPVTAPAGVDDGALPVLGMLAYSELAAFTRLAADSALAPTLAERLALARLARHALDSLDDVAARVAELGGDLQPVMAPFSGVLLEFDRRTQPSTWWERLLKAYVGYGVADDFTGMVSAAVDPTTRVVVADALSDDGLAQLVVDTLAAAALQDATLASRLALWGRRLVGEALGVVQSVLTVHPEIQVLVERAMPEGEGQARMFAMLTAEHSRRMQRLGLTP